MRLVGPIGTAMRTPTPPWCTPPHPDPAQEATLKIRRTLGATALAALAAAALTTSVLAAPAQAAPTTTTHSQAQLHKAQADLDASAKVPGTAWVVDPASNQVVVSVDPTVDAAGLAKINAVAARSGGAVTVRRVADRFSLTMQGGDPIYSSGYRCSLGFNVHTSSGTPYFLTAGHCGNINPYWYNSSNQFIGQVAHSYFPGYDFAILQYAAGVPHTSSVNLYNGSSQPIYGAANAYVGEYVCRSGSTTGVHCGSVTGLNATVNYSQGTVYGLIQTNVCAEGGDSGGSLFDGNYAIGLTSGGSGNCSSGGTTFFMPVTTVLNYYGVAIG